MAMDIQNNKQWNIGELYRAARRELAALSDACQTEALLLCRRFLGVGDRAALLVRSEEAVDAQTAQLFLDALSRRRTSPLQYILGSWDFDGMELQVGQGVLVPREDTLALVEAAWERLAALHRPVRILDLCAGSGAVGLALARRLPQAQVTCLELSTEAIYYLDNNIEKYGDGRTVRLQADVLAGFEAAGIAPGSFDAIVSNPPYIPADEIPGLAREVRQEPKMALDGGTDGLDFYRAIAEKWQGALASGGLLCMEHGMGQFEDVKRIIVRHGWGEIGAKQDFSGKIRAIIGTLTR